MKTILKYLLKPNANSSTCPPIMIAKDATILTVAGESDKLWIWVEADIDALKMPAYFEVFLTGDEMHTLKTTRRKYVGTAFLEKGQIVLHIYHRLDLQ